MLRVPGHTDYRGDPIDSFVDNTATGVAPDLKDHESAIASDMDDIVHGWNESDYWTNGDEEALQFKEEDEYDMDLTQ
jgi:hypothetical protein